MIVTPYRRPPAPPTVALLTTQGEVLDERGQLWRPGTTLAETRVWVSFDTVRELVAAGHGEALCWRGEELRWRHKPLDPPGEWTPRQTDAIVVKLPLDDDFPMRTVYALARWRDWLAAYRAVPGSLGSAAWSLLRATLDGPLITSSPVRARPPLRQTIGGRQHIGRHGRGRFVGRVEQWDMPAAYASELGTLTYGGRWRTASDFEKSRALEWWAADDRPVFARVRVRVPDGVLGPLPERARGFNMAAALGLTEYPTGCRLQGFWTVQEIWAAEAAGCRLERVQEVWAHLAAGERPFTAWWEAIQAGRAMGGLPGLLAKTTGNALLGRFHMDARAGRKTIRRNGRLYHVETKGGIPPAHDLAETVTGRVRAALYGLLAARPTEILSAHTDGVWTRAQAGETPPEGWRRKLRASQLDLLGPQTLRYTPSGGRLAGVPCAVMSGTPYRQADAAFEEAWALYVGEQQGWVAA